MNNIIRQIEAAINNAELGETKLSDKAFSIEGMSGRKNRILLNSILSTKDTKYLEVGVWKGSTFYSALYKNCSSIRYAVGIDNWSEFNGPRQEFINNMNDISTDFEFYDEDCFLIDKTKFKTKFNIFFYDGNHNLLNQEKALSYFLDSMEDEFIYICDDWDFDHVKAGTISGLKKANLQIKRDWVLGQSGTRADHNNWWCGVYVAYCKKIETRF